MNEGEIQVVSSLAEAPRGDWCTIKGAEHGIYVWRHRDTGFLLSDHTTAEEPKDDDHFLVSDSEVDALASFLKK